MSSKSGSEYLTCSADVVLVLRQATAAATSCLRHNTPHHNTPHPTTTHNNTQQYRLAAQLARTEEAAKRALIRADQGAKGSTAQQLLDAQRQIQQLQAENSELSSKLAK